MTRQPKLERPPLQFSLIQLLGMTTLCGGLFWFVSQFGIAVSLFVTGAIVVQLVAWQRRVDSFMSGAMLGVFVHGLLGSLLRVFGAVQDPLVLFVLHVLPGGYIAGFSCQWRQLTDVMAVDRAREQVDSLEVVEDSVPAHPLDAE